MKSLTRTILIAVALFGAQCAAWAQGTGAESLEVSVDGNIAFNPCVPEPVMLAGSIRVVQRIQSDSAEGTHILTVQAGQGVTGIGLDTNTRYVLGGTSPSLSRLIIPEGASTNTLTATFHLVAPGSGGSGLNFFAHLLVHVTINANGELTAELGPTVPECR